MVAIDQPRFVLLKEMRKPIVDTAAGEDFLAGRPHLTPHLANEVDFPLEKMLYEAGYRSRVTLPLRIGDKSIGMMNIGWTVPEGFEPGQIPLLTQIASAMALALERSRLFEETRRRSTELTALHELSLAVNASLEDPSQVMQMAVDRTMHLLEALGAGIFISDEKGELQVGAVDSPGLSLTDGEFSILKDIWERFSTSDEPIQVLQITDLSLENHVAQKRLEQGIELVYVIRLVHGKEQLGMLAVLWPHPHVTDAEKQNGSPALHPAEAERLAEEAPAVAPR